MENLKIKAKCPFCGLILIVPKYRDENKSVTCPSCKQNTLFKDFVVIREKQEEKTELPQSVGSESTQYEKSTVKVDDVLKCKVGKLVDLESGSCFQLKIGRQVIGRKCINPPHADFEMLAPTKRMSREHLVVEVKNVPGRGLLHYASLYKEKVNETFIGNVRLSFGDSIILNDGDIIKLPDVKVKFEIADEEKTEIA